MAKTIDSIHKDIIAKMTIAAENALIEGVQLAQDYMDTEWYGRYEPLHYDRLYALFNSLRIKCTPKGNNIYARIYIQDGVHPISNSFYGHSRTFDEIYKWFATGKATGEDRYGQKLDVLKYTEEELIGLGKALDIIKDTMKKYGYNIK